MQNLKNLIPRQILSDEAFAPVMKKAQDHRKATQQCIDFFQQISKLYESYISIDYKWNIVDQPPESKKQFYNSLKIILKIVQRSGLQLSQNTKCSFKQLTSLCNTIFHEFSKFILNFQQSLRQYQASEQIILQLIKKYFKTHRAMLNLIQAYKSSFSDVNIIYNMDEKIKRYQACEACYKEIKQQFNNIQDKIGSLTTKKIQLTEICINMENQFIKVAQIIGTKIISETKNFFSYFCKCHKQLIPVFATQKYNLESLKINSFFSEIEYENKLQYFTQTKNIVANKLNIPYIFIYYDIIRQECLENYNAEMMQYLKKVQESIQKRKNNNKNIVDLILQFYKNIEKILNPGIKQIIVFFEKMKKKLGDVFSYRLVSFVKSINSIFQLYSGLNEKMFKNIYPRFQAIQNLIAEEAKLLKLFGDELKSNIIKFIGKKQVKKIKQQSEFTEQTNIVNIRLFRKQISQKSQFLKHLIQGFNEKMQKNSEKIRQNYLQIIKDHYQQVNQFYSFCCEYQQLYFGQDQFKSNFQKYQTDIDALLTKQKEYLAQLPIATLKTEKDKITFDGDFGKIEDFKKIKKPKVDKNQNKQQPSSQTKTEKRITLNDKNEGEQKMQKKQEEEPNQAKKAKQLPAQRQTYSIEDRQLKNAEFLAGKIQFGETQQLIKSFSCALVDKIVLQGRIYITTDRICFHSKFNSGNLFFGGTFIQIPHKDIKKVQKKKNSFFLDNMVSITTINGQVSFTSFFSRDQAYDIICKTFEINLDDVVYQFTQPQQLGLPDFLIELEQEDDIKRQDEKQREQKITQQLLKFEYNNAVKGQYERQGFNALKIFKVFYSTQQINMGKRTYPNFLIYYKGLINHKDLEVTEFNPPLQTIINQSNLKNNSPLCSTRCIKMTVPVSAPGVPFVPKTAKSSQNQRFYFISKHKWILQSQVVTVGAPYTDTFKVELRTTVESTQQGKTTITIGYYINFIKNTMMKSVIQSKTQQQTMSASRIQIQQIKRYFINLQKTLNSNKIKTDPLTQLQEQIKTKNQQLNTLYEQKDKLTQEIDNVKALKIKRQYALIGSIILNLLLFFVVIGT